MVFYRDAQPGDQPLQSDTYGLKPLGGQMVLKHTDEQTQRSDKELLDSGYLSDCEVICGNTKWATHKVILCSRNKWFRAAFDGPFQEASAGVVTVEEIDPLVFQVVLDYIYTGAINTFCHTPAKIIEIWKAGGFFGINDLVAAAEEALKKRLRDSHRVMSRNLRPGKIHPEYTHCAEGNRVMYTLCGHNTREARECPAQKVQPHTIFRNCRPENIIYRERVCSPRCFTKYVRKQATRLERVLLNQPEPDAQHRYTRPALSSPSKERAWPIIPKWWRLMCEEEIRLLGEALVYATAETPPGSRVQGMLIMHLCGTRLRWWDGFSLCDVNTRQKSATCVPRPPALLPILPPDRTRNHARTSTSSPFSPSSAAAATSGASLCLTERVGLWRVTCGKYGNGPVGSDSISTSSSAADRPAPPDYELRAMIEGEIRALYEAVVAATVDTPKGSRVQEALIDHM